MPTDHQRAKDIFVDLVSNVPPDEWADRLVQTCEGDVDLETQVRALLRAHAAPDTFMDQPAIAANATLDTPIAERPGTVIGPYKLLQQIGEGGMGVVFMAEQIEPIQRTVALKIIKPGMDTRQVIARFEAERQAVAMMDHPNIAKVLDAGTTDSGRPYFVMELVKGVPITKYCDDKRLPIRDRLQLFMQVCQAVQHAHQKGIIHRDIKPNNVLVAEYDDHAIPKVIDFGVAKATAQRLTERTMFTEFGQVLGTMEYMSPEQSKFNQLDIDTRSDIYSLGVLLYELLAGSTPFEGKRLKEAAFDEMLRIIREEEPPNPSTRLSAIETLPSVAANRHSEPARLTNDVRGELDWIVMKALEKDRNRRYETASSFAADIERHLHDEPVEAGPPSAAYRFRKFARRNKVALATAIMVALAVLIAVGSIGWAARDRAAREEQLAHDHTARQAKVSGQLELILNDVARLEKAEMWSEALASVKRAEPALAGGEAPPDIQNRVRQALADLEFVQQVDEIRMRSGTPWSDIDVRHQFSMPAEKEYSAAFRQTGIDIDALPLKQAVDRINERSAITAAVLPAVDDWVAVRSMGQDESATHRLIELLRATDPDPWRQQMRDAVARKDALTLVNLAKSPELERQPAATMSFLSISLRANFRPDEWIEVLIRAQRKYPADYWINHRLGLHYIWQQSPNVIREGIGYMRAAVAVRPRSSYSFLNLGNGYHHLGELDEAIACYRKAIEISPKYPAAYSNLGNTLTLKGIHDEAIACQHKAVELSPGDCELYSNLAISLSRNGRYDPAIVAFEKALKLKPDFPEACAEFSMILSNCPDARLQVPRRALKLANKAVEVDPNLSLHWTALGVACYREGQWHEARTAFEKSQQLGTNGVWGEHPWADGIDWFFLAMTHWQLREHDEARRYYSQAVEFIAKNKDALDKGEPWKELVRLRKEAEELMKVTDKKATTKPPVEVK